MSATSEDVEMSETSSETSSENKLIIQLKIVESLSPSKVYKHFEEQFGPIAMASFIPGFAFIMFDYDDDDIMQMLAEHRTEIEGLSILVKRADYSNLPYKMYKCVRMYMTSKTPKTAIGQILLQPEDEASPKNILNALNEDCVYKILLRLSLLDHCNISKTCVQLNGIAKIVFDRKYKNKTIVLEDLKRGDETLTMMQIRYFLNNFGSSITSISLLGKIEDGINNDVVGLLNAKMRNERINSKVTTIFSEGEEYQTIFSEGEEYQTIFSEGEEYQTIFSEGEEYQTVTLFGYSIRTALLALLSVTTHQ